MMGTEGGDNYIRRSLVERYSSLPRNDFWCSRLESGHVAQGMEPSLGKTKQPQDFRPAAVEALVILPAYLPE